MVSPVQAHRILEHLKKIWLWILVLALLGGNVLEARQPGLAAGNAPPKVFLPVLASSTQGNKPPVMLGIYPMDWWAPTPQGVINNEFRPLDAWAGKGTSLAGIFHDLQNGTEGNVTNQFATIWANGYTPFVNLYAGVSAYKVASGAIDPAIRAWARYYANYAQNGARAAFLAPLQEMNGNWTPYGLDPVNFKIAYRRIRDIFKQEGVPDQSVFWVFAPNGYTQPGTPPIADYYPGDDVVDVVAFSAYNYGYHPQNSYKKWETPDEVFSPYINILQAIAPTKPIFIAQTGTTAYTAHGWDAAAKNQWLTDAYNYLAGEPGVQAVVYYNADNQFDWAIYSPSGYQFAGYPQGVKNPAYDYVPPNKLNSIYHFK